MTTQNLPEGAPRFRFSALTVIKILISGGAVLWLLFTIQWRVLFEKTEGIDWLMLGVSIAVFSTWILPCSLRWRQIAESCGYSISLGESTRGYLMGAFFSSFLPTGKGGDIVRGILLSKSHHFSLGGILATVFFERFVGFSVALFLVLFSSFMAMSRHPVFKGIVFSVTGLALVLLGLLLVYFNPSFRNLCSRFVQKLPVAGLKKASGDFSEVVGRCFENPLLISSTMGLSLLNQMILIISGFLIASSIPGFNAPWISFPLVIPLNFIAVLLPSIGGYGIREASFIIFFGWFGVSEEAAGLFGMLQLLFFWVFSVAGGYCFITGKARG